MWISFWGYSELNDVKYDQDKLSFTRTTRFRDNEYTSSFSGTIKEDKITGTVSSDRGDYSIEGKHVKVCPVVGNWEIKTTMGEREFISTLLIKADKDGKLSGEWKRPDRPERRREQDQDQQRPDQERRGPRGQSVIKDMTFEDEKLTFTRIRGSGERQRESKYELKLEGDALSGERETQRGTIKMTASSSCLLKILFKTNFFIVLVQNRKVKPISIDENHIGRANQPS